jgi:uncharacterized phage protein (TIGR02216 family)
MAFGFGVLRLSSEEFWCLTPRELSSAVRVLPGDSAPVSRGILNELIARFPDQTPTLNPSPASGGGKRAPISDLSEIGMK